MEDPHGAEVIAASGCEGPVEDALGANTLVASLALGADDNLLAPKGAQEAEVGLVVGTRHHVHQDGAEALRATEANGDATFGGVVHDGHRAAIAASLAGAGGEADDVGGGEFVSHAESPWLQAARVVLSWSLYGYFPDVEPPKGDFLHFQRVQRRMSFVVVIAQGIFRVMEEGHLPVAFPDGEDPKDLEELLPTLEGREVKALLHHTPPLPPDPSMGGGGACLWPPGMCPCGHNEDKGWLYSGVFEGKVRQEEGVWFVGDVRVPFEMLPGHRGRFSAVTTGVDIKRPPDSAEAMELGDLLGEAEGLGATLASLQAFLKED